MLSCIPCIVRFLLMTTVFRDDTPLYYLLNGKEETAQQVVAKMYFPEYVQEVLDDIRKEAEAQTLRKESWGDLFQPKYSKRTEIGIVMQIIQQLSGVNAVVFYSGTIFSTAMGSNATDARYMVIALGCF